ncbi:temperature-induced lipocalin-1-like [Diospyros lotus]|uniref:temperature-induced lipocalin-1-like n=1 Tax=Diospyros lotus TaxID=55363 RepID=UPI00225986CE|nr:temperature-induced lipocalin-1-like [Diospyros lotus]
MALPLKTVVASLCFLVLLCNFSINASSPTPTSQNPKKSASPESGKADQKELRVVKGLDLKRYMGRWYEIASFPQPFMPPNATNTRATYSLRADGTVNVLNEAFVNGKRIAIEGVAYRAHPSSDEAKFKLRFPNVPVIGNYWVLYIDRRYQYALVGEPTRMSLFILSRKNHIDEKKYKKLVKMAKDEGYDVTKLQKTKQTNPPPKLQ